MRWFVSGGWKVSHFRGQGEPPPSRQSEHAFRHKPPQHQAKGVCGEKHAGEQGGSILAAIMAHFLTAIDNRCSAVASIRSRKRVSKGASNWWTSFVSRVKLRPSSRATMCRPGRTHKSWA